jgi:hypothetical protein
MKSMQFQDAIPVVAGKLTQVCNESMARQSSGIFVKYSG